MPKPISYGADLERHLAVLSHSLTGVKSHLKPRALAIKLVEGDEPIREQVIQQMPGNCFRPTSYREVPAAGARAIPGVGCDR